MFKISQHVSFESVEHELFDFGVALFAIGNRDVGQLANRAAIAGTDLLSRFEVTAAERFFESFQK